MNVVCLCLLFLVLVVSGCNCWDISEGESESDGGHTIWRIKNSKDTSIYDVEEAGADISDMSDMSDACTPNCKDKECGDDGCGGSCGNNSVCSSNKCVCNIGYANCNKDLSDGCEKQGDTKHLWSKSFGGSDWDEGYSVSVDSLGNVYITGRFYSSTIDFGGGALTNANIYGGSAIYLAKFDSNGNHLWSKRFEGSGDDEGKSVSVDS